TTPWPTPRAKTTSSLLSVVILALSAAEWGRTPAFRFCLCRRPFVVIPQGSAFAFLTQAEEQADTESSQPPPPPHQRPSHTSPSPGSKPVSTETYARSHCSNSHRDEENQSAPSPLQSQNPAPHTAPESNTQSRTPPGVQP